MDSPADIEKLKAALAVERARAAEAEAELAITRAKAADDAATIARQKLEIAKRYLTPRQIKQTGLTDEQIVLDYRVANQLQFELIDEALLTQLYGMAVAEPDKPVMLRRGAQWEPLFCIIPVSLTSAIEQAWQTGERSNRNVLLALHARALEIDQHDTRLANLNSPNLLAEHVPPAGT